MAHGSEPLGLQSSVAVDNNIFYNVLLGVSFASYYGNHMVLQQAPKRAQIWGYAKNSQIGQSVNLQVNHTSNSYQRVYTTSVVKGNNTEDNVEDW